MSKVYRNKRTKELFMKVESGALISLFDGHGETFSEKKYDEVDTAPVKQQPTVIHTEQITSGVTSFDKIQSLLNNEDEFLDKYFRVGDILYIPIEGFEKPVPIEIVHMDYDKRRIYLMSRDILAKMPMDKVEAYFEELLDKLPYDFVSHMKPIEHINKNGTHKTLISLPSIKNMGRYEDQCKGEDDIKFKKFETESSRCKDFKWQSCWYLSDTPYATTSTDFWYVGSYGGMGYANDYHSGGVCPFFLLSKDQDECNK